MVVLSARDAGIQLTNLTKSYGTVAAVRGVDAVIAPGETLGPLGPNGAGKTTTLDMVLDLSRPDEGSVTVFGRSTRDAVSAGRVGGHAPGRHAARVPQRA